VGDGGVHHRLLVARQHVGQVAVAELLLEQRLADARDVAVAEDPEAAGEEALAPPVPLAPLVGEEAHDGLTDGEPHRAHEEPPIGSRGSISRPTQVARISPCAGSSQMSQTRSGPGPAMTLR